VVAAQKKVGQQAVSKPASMDKGKTMDHSQHTAA
jgi:hypothetical protein